MEEFMRIFKILGIEPTKNEMEIKEAYLNKLSDTNPEDKPEEFMQLRKAYEEAIEYANQEDEEDTNEIDNTEIGLWMAKVREVYNNFRARNDINAWSFRKISCLQFPFAVEIVLFTFTCLSLDGGQCDQQKYEKK